KRARAASSARVPESPTRERFFRVAGWESGRGICPAALKDSPRMFAPLFPDANGAGLMRIPKRLPQIWLGLRPQEGLASQIPLSYSRADEIARSVYGRSG